MCLRNLTGYTSWPNVTLTYIFATGLTAYADPTSDIVSNRSNSKSTDSKSFWVDYRLYFKYRLYNIGHVFLKDLPFLNSPCSVRISNNNILIKIHNIQFHYLLRFLARVFCSTLSISYKTIKKMLINCECVFLCVVK